MQPNRRARGARGPSRRRAPSGSIAAAVLLGALVALSMGSAPASARSVGEAAPSCALRALGGTPRNATPTARDAADSHATIDPGTRPATAGTRPAAAPVLERRFDGEVWLVDFWASWCPSCEEAFAFLDELERELGPRGLQVVAVNLDADVDDALAFLAERPVAFEVWSDPTGRCPRAFGVGGMPWSVLIDRAGRIVAVQRGFRPREARALRERIERLLPEATDLPLATTTPEHRTAP